MAFTVTYQASITLEQVSSLLVSAFEGGSNSWYMIEEEILPTTWEFDSEPKRENNKHWRQDVALNPGGALLISDKNDEEHIPFRLDLESIQKGLDLMATQEPRHFQDILDENADAETGDIFLQYCLFGEIVYC